MNISVLVNNKTKIKIKNLKKFVKQVFELLNVKGVFEISIVFCNNEFITELNKKYRGKDYPTDVLSFEGIDNFLGDIVISIEKANEQKNESLKKEIEDLLIHGILHLLGYDHEKNEEEYIKFFNIQKNILENIKEGIIINEAQ
ncbi:MAG TPA: rRNA maturation RNase YbeY [Spirochaetota bacterium]|nr:rRNA maturation RNase YbeY [Spirochaetota bacterium]HOM38176.1 rRNA maturation RNase YbeY [Spirochaetota bacterium]HPQ48606.1 rRNA maturation RNase YbeY [Spirochaetota bacterium]